MIVEMVVRNLLPAAAQVAKSLATWGSGFVEFYLQEVAK